MIQVSETNLRDKIVNMHITIQFERQLANSIGQKLPVEIWWTKGTTHAQLNAIQGKENSFKKKSLIKSCFQLGQSLSHNAINSLTNHISLSLKTRCERLR